MDNNLTYITRKLREGDDDTYVFLFRKYYVPLCSYARRYVGRKDVAEEIVSETFFNIWRNRATLEIRSSVKGYLFHAVCNNSLNYLRKLKKEENLDHFFKENAAENSHFILASEELPFDSLLLKDLTKTIDDAVASLPPQQQTVFRLKRYEGKKNGEIAEIMGLSVKTVEMHLSKALLSLRKNLKDYLPEFLLFLFLNSIF
ncbi:RNA polymerase sigma-70 factor [Gaoshiqia sp. Z1-71]|uniref:RNA polymerase sigma-70 factor n=1 Tax=Gaoshiqia hydrogeniformans TaxID=3290090 RepID=UPI003BF7DB73